MSESLTNVDIKEDFKTVYGYISIRKAVFKH